MSANATLLKSMLVKDAAETDAAETDILQAYSQSASEATRHYHQRTKHTFQAYAKGPDTLDWDAQPAPFRHFSGAETVALPSYASLQNPVLLEALQQPFVSPVPPTQPLPLTLETLSALLQLSFGITAWKTYGPDRWAVRANPSSGNLHPTEVYVLIQHMKGMKDGLYHYRVEDHALERRATLMRLKTSDSGAQETPILHIALSSVMWREAWKYGERAFRYCQLDTGHAIGALSYATHVLGWEAFDQQVDTPTLNTLLGLNRLGDFPYKRVLATELEEAEVLMRIALTPSSPPRTNKSGAKRSSAASQPLLTDKWTGQWTGLASTIDAHPMYQWSIIGEVAAATRLNAPHSTPKAALPSQTKACLDDSATSLPQTAASQLILQRRSAQRFNPQYTMPNETFRQLLQALLPSNQTPWNALSSPPLINLVFWVHRVEGLLPGLYALMRAPRLASPFNAALAPHFTREAIYPLENHTSAKEAPFMRLHAIDTGTLHRLARSLHCHQDIASNACFAVGMLAEFDAPIAHDPAYYRDMHHEAGLIGQVLYLHAELHGVRGTGIGCFFDDPVHEVLGLTDAHFQSIYHFTVGQPMEDSRISTVFTCASQPETNAVKHANSASTDSNLTPLSTLST